MFSPLHAIEAALAIIILSTLFVLSRYALIRLLHWRHPSPPIVVGKGGSRPSTGGERLDKHTSNLLTVQALLLDDPELEATLFALLLRRRRAATIAQLTGSIAMNTLSIIAGWLLSSLVDPHTVLPFLPR